MRYVSTRGAAPILDFADVLLAGLARDGGLYVPEAWPALKPGDFADLAGRPYAEIATRVMAPFASPAIAEADLVAICAAAYRDFAHRAVAPLKELSPGLWLMELFHGPTLAFKDYALQLVGLLFDHVLAKRGERITIVAATSGDTGSAAIEACRGRASIDIVVLHPHGRVSEVQRRQMTTVDAPNVVNVAINGTFDDCQDLVKAMFNDLAFRDRFQLSAMNSINWARIAAQIVYYVVAATALGAPARPVSFAVPTGNFGNIFAGYAAKRMGLPVGRLICASNRNDILARFLACGTMTIETVEPSLSPSMDIQVSSNFERLLFELFDRDAPALTQAMNAFRATGTWTLAPERFTALRQLFTGARVDDAATLATIARIHGECGELVDPHTAVGIAAAEGTKRRDETLVCLATAHPAKFPDAVEKATGLRPALPPRLADLGSRKERYDVLPNDLVAVQDFITGRLGKR
ncbi:MAG: threonine synthase [Alphaproteobacteria bacterium]